VHFELLFKAKRHLAAGGNSSSFIPLFYATLKLLDRVKVLEFPKPETDQSEEKIENEETSDEEIQNQEPINVASQEGSREDDIKAAQSSEYFSSEENIVSEENVEPTSSSTETSSQSDLFANAPIPDTNAKNFTSSHQIT
jgi:hypothetical protein